MKTKVLMTACCMLMLGCCLTGCKEDEEEKVPLTGITVNPTSLTMAVGDKRTIAATPIPENATDVQFSWVSKSPAIATVSQAGEVEAKTVSAAGTDIEVRCGEIVATVHVTVAEAVIALERIAVEKGNPGEALTAPYEVEIILGEVLKLTPKPVPANSTQTDFGWTTDPETTDILSVNNVNGVVSALTRGEAHVVVTESESGKTARIKVTVLPKVLTGIALSPDKEATTLKVGQHEDFTATPVPEGADNTFVWESDDATVATVDNGRITAVRAGGTTVTVRNSNSSVSKKIKVTVAAADLIVLTQPAEGATLAEWPSQFPYHLEWLGADGYTGNYTIKIADSEQNLAATPFTLDAGANTSYELTEDVCAGLLDAAQIPKDDTPHTLYWTVAPATETPGITTEARSINVVRFANIAPKQYWPWIGVTGDNDCYEWNCSNPNVRPENAIDGDLNTSWRCVWMSYSEHRIAIDLGKLCTISKITIHSEDPLTPKRMRFITQEAIGSAENNLGDQFMFSQPSKEVGSVHVLSQPVAARYLTIDVVESNFDPTNVQVVINEIDLE